MCGIWAMLYAKESLMYSSFTDEEIMRCIQKMEARGPEGTRVEKLSDSIILGFTRLAINGLNEKGMQPFEFKNKKWICNGEIYNAKELEQKVGVSESGSDCEVIGKLYHQSEGDMVAFARALDGVFAIVLWDDEKKECIVARDPYGVRPLYYGRLGGMIGFASERKGLDEKMVHIEEFPPGEVWRLRVRDEAIEIVEQLKYHTVPWIKMADSTDWITKLREGLTAAVRKRLMTERPVAALLSGGVDSSLIAALVQRELKNLKKPALKTFSIGMPGSTDLKYAKMVAEHIGSDHTEILTSADEMFSCIPEVIHDIESYDTTTVRASVGNWMVAREIRRRTECKVVFNGDGSDEIFGSYLYFYRAPNDMAFERETERLLNEISKYDVLRSDRSISSHGLEPRTPFLDKQFVATAMSLPTDLRRPTSTQPEKWALRMAFQYQGLLPTEVLWRRKEAFSDGVSCMEKSWYEEIQERIEARGLVEEGWEEKAKSYRVIPKTKESYYYMKLYMSLYKNTARFWPYWMPRWSPETNDPSARSLSVYTK
jgi:asparagine synthase (glutamine-hydrolysing)